MFASKCKTKGCDRVFKFKSYKRRTIFLCEKCHSKHLVKVALEWQERNKVRHNESQMHYRESHKKEISEYNAKYFKENKEKIYKKRKETKDRIKKYLSTLIIASKVIKKIKDEESDEDVKRKSGAGCIKTRPSTSFL